MSNSEKIRFNRFMKICWRVIVDNYIVDCLKAPAPNPPKPALLSAASFNIYFSQNMSKSEDGKFVFWNGYGLGSGAKTIGLDQRFICIYPFFPQLINLLSLVRVIIGRSFPDLNCFFDTISVKGYWCYPNRRSGKTNGKMTAMKTNYHRDIAFNINGEPDKNNSQLPGTPVAICAWGSNKKFILQRYFHGLRFKKKLTNWKRRLKELAVGRRWRAVTSLWNKNMDPFFAFILMMSCLK